MSSHLQLFRWNIVGDPNQIDLLPFERNWIDRARLGLQSSLSPVHSFSDLKKQLESISEAPATSPSADFVANEMKLHQFKQFIQEYVPDGLTEAYAMFSALPRISGEAQFPVMRILMDEFGKGNERRSHSQLYRNLLTELGLPTALEQYGNQLNEESFAFVNIYHWLAKRAEKIDYYLGALAYSERIIPWSFQCLVAACNRLGLREKGYFTEHVHIDRYHTKEAFSALELLADKGKLDLNAALIGARLAKYFGDLAFAAAVKKVRMGAAA